MIEDITIRTDLVTTNLYNVDTKNQFNEWSTKIMLQHYHNICDLVKSVVCTFSNIKD